VRAALAEQLATHAPDAAALGCAVLGALVLLGIATDAGGPLGDALDTALGAVLGRARYLVPFALFVTAALLVARRNEAPQDRHGWRLGIGCVLVLMASTGLLHLAAHHHGASDLAELRRAGGALGALVGSAVAGLTGTVGATIVLGVAVAFGVLLVSDLTLHQVAIGLAVAARWTGAQVHELLDLHGGEDEDLDLDGEDDGVDGDLLAFDDAHVGAPPPPARRATLYDELADTGYYDVDLVGAEAQEADADEDDDEDDADEDDECDVFGEADDDEYEDGEEEEEDEEGDDEEYEEYDEDEEYEDDEEEGGDEDEEEEDEEEGDEHADGARVQAHLDLGPGYRATNWKLPAANLLKRGGGKQVDERLVDAGGEVLEATMREFGVDARLIGRTIGPTVTRYELELAPGVKVNKVTGLAKEIAYAMASHDVRILAPIPGRSAIGVEVPNRERPIVTLGDILASDDARKPSHPLEVGLGRDIAGRSVMANLATFPHVLIAGQTGAGKSSCINSIVTTLLMRTTPEQVRLILVDPKRVELGQYNHVPHLLTEVVVNPKKAANALDWAVREMELRYDLLAEVGVRDITGYNAMWDRGDLPTRDDPDPTSDKVYERLPFVVIVVDELADLMMVAARDVESSIARLAQMARAVGLHLVIATQRPSVDVITGVIKANIPSRLAFSVSSLTDSRVILDQPGAEKLVGKGDMLMLTASSARTERIQGAWVDEDCVRKVVAHWRRQAMQPSYVEGVQGDDSAVAGSRVDDGETDELLEQAMDLVVRSGLGSTSMLQRKLRVGFARAGRLMDLLERRGIVGPSEGSKARAVLMTVEELDDLQPRV
jgi:S-DNA-T family DNA segregation ATPase FtsK/SpoIIIE